MELYQDQGTANMWRKSCHNLVPNHIRSLIKKILTSVSQLTSFAHCSHAHITPNHLASPSMHCTIFRATCDHRGVPARQDTAVDLSAALRHATKDSGRVRPADLTHSRGRCGRPRATKPRFLWLWVRSLHGARGAIRSSWRRCPGHGSIRRMSSVPSSLPLSSAPLWADPLAAGR